MQRLRHQRSGNPISQIFAGVGAVLLVGVAFFLGLFFLTILAGLAVIGMVTFLARVWWFRYKLNRAHRSEESSRESNVLEGEYVIVERTSRAEIDEEKE